MSMRERSSKQASDLPPKRRGKAVRHDVSKPLQHVSFSRVIYLLSIFAVLFTAFYAYRIFQWKAEVGGWWNLAMGKRPPHLDVQADARSGSVPHAGSGTKQDIALESHIHEVASILGMQPTDLASVLRDAVHQHVAPKTVSSLSSSISASGTSAPAASIIFDSSYFNTGGTPGPDGVSDKVGTVARAVEAIAGFDEPVMAD